MDRRIILLLGLMILLSSCGGKQLTDDRLIDGDPWPAQGADGTYYLAWYSEINNNPDIMLKISKDGIEWDEGIAIIKGKEKDFHPSLTIDDSGTFHLVWYRIEEDGSNIYYSQSSDAKKWSEPLRLTYGPKINWAPSVMINDEGYIFVVYSSVAPFTKDIHIMASIDRGMSWTIPFMITQGNDDNDFPHMIQKDDGSYQMIWVKSKQLPLLWSKNPTSELMTSTSADGFEWMKPEQLTDDEFIDIQPHLFEKKGRTYMIWTSTRTDRAGDIVQSPVDELIVERISKTIEPESAPRVLETKSDFFTVWVQRKGLQSDIHYVYQNNPVR